MKKYLSVGIASAILFSVFPLSACSTPKNNVKKENEFRIASWMEYIDEGGSVYKDTTDPALQDFKQWYLDLTGIDLTNSRPLYEEFQDWYNKTYNKNISVKYIDLQDNETMYNQIKMGDSYDILCPSEYMAMKMKAEGLLKPFSNSFYNKDIEGNYYAQNVSPYITQTFADAGLTGYIAGYMWGTTGFVFNPEKIDREVMKSWRCLSSKACKSSITAKDNVRDSYFMGLGYHFEDELLAKKEEYKNGIVSREAYKSYLKSVMNDTNPETMANVKKDLENIRGNLYGLETDEAKNEMIMERLDASYQWSGDAVYILDEAENSSGLELEYSIPEAASNIWFDGWVMMQDANEEIASAFINFLSRPENVIRNMYYIGYTSCIASDNVFNYVEYSYSAEEENSDTEEYDLSYFFGEGYSLTVPTKQTRRQLFAQYPTEDVIDRLVVMNYFNAETNERASRMWNNIK